MAEMDRATTPYAYAFDDPIRHTDPDGMFGEDVNESDDQDGPGKGVKVAAEIAITTNPGLGGIQLDAFGDGIFRGAQFGLSATAGAVFGTIGLVLLPAETGGGASKTTLPPELIAAPLLLAKSKKEEKPSEPSTIERGTAGKLDKSPTGKGTVPASQRAKQRVPTAKEKAKEREANDNDCTDCGNKTKKEPII